MTLTVTDNRGGTGTVTHVGDGDGAEPAPTAALHLDASRKLVASFDGIGSTDSDGTIASYAWNFGDGGTGTGPTRRTPTPRRAPTPCS